MTNVKKVYFLLVMVFVISGCGTSRQDLNISKPPVQENETDHTRKINVNLLTSEKKLPPDFEEAAFKRQTVPYYQYLVTKAEDQTEYTRLWSYFQLTQSDFSVNFAENDVLFIGVRESGTCPYDLGDVRMNAEGTELTIPLLGQGEVCTADATPKTFVFEVTKEEGKRIEDLIIEEGSTKTAVPFAALN